MSYHWVIFSLIIFFLLSIEFILSLKKKKVSLKENVWLTVMYILIGVGYSLYVYYEKGIISAQQYLNGYIVEKILSVDNIFIFVIIFRYLSIPTQLRRKVLYYGILGAIVFRGIMISAGVVLIKKIDFILYVFGAITIFTGIKLILPSQINKEYDIEHNIVLRLVNRFFRIDHSKNTTKFLVRKKGKFYLTRLSVALILVECVDLLFAIDSIPVIFTITTDPYIVYTANMFAILGFRSLYFCVSDMLEKLKYLKHTLAAILVFVGSKIFIQHLVGEIPVWFSLSVSVALLTIGISISLMVKQSKSNN